MSDCWKHDGIFGRELDAYIEKMEKVQAEMEQQENQQYAAGYMAALRKVAMMYLNTTVWKYPQDTYWDSGENEPVQ